MPTTRETRKRSLVFRKIDKDLEMKKSSAEFLSSVVQV